VAQGISPEFKSQHGKKKKAERLTRTKPKLMVGVFMMDNGYQTQVIYLQLFISFPFAKMCQ
jgi:hypothetical protein